MLTSQLALALAALVAVKPCLSVPFENEVEKLSSEAPPSLIITSPALTSKWFEGTDQVQIIEMYINNTGSINWLTAADALSVTLVSDSLTLVTPGTLIRLRPGDSAVVQIGVQNKVGVTTGSTCNGTVVATWGGSYGTPQTTSTAVSGNCGIGNYTASKSSLDFHQSPEWFNEIKYGIFIHWGIYSAPAYGSVSPNESYAEWYWNHMHDPTEKTQTYKYHLETYGEYFNYDDFISNFTASKFDAKSWVDLIADAGAQYLVPVTKHHDGFALFDFPSTISTRSSVHLGPKRDFIGEILNAAKEYQPHLRRGPPINPYTNQTIEYTGFVNHSDFVTGIQLPQMNILAYNYETEIMWCDIGGANNSTIFASAWLNWARAQGRQVTFNSRCGLTGDYSTPEYKTNSVSVAHKWESTRGMDPFSFGYNYQTSDDQYLTSEGIVQALVDIVSKNGNFLLDIGPRNDGTIAEIMVTNLKAAGVWIKAHAESIFKTRYWLKTPGLDPLRYTTTNEAFYIHVLKAPTTGNVSIPDPIPYLSGDKVAVVGGSLAGEVVPLVENEDGTYTLTISDAVLAADQYVWTFKISYSGST